MCVPQERPKTSKSEPQADDAPGAVEGSEEAEAAAPADGQADEKKHAVVEEAKGNPVEETVPAEPPAEQTPQEQAPDDAPPDA